MSTDNVEPSRIIKSKLLVSDNKGGVNQLLPQTIAKQVNLDSGKDLETAFTEIEQKSNSSINVVTQFPDIIEPGATYFLVK